MWTRWFFLKFASYNQCSHFFKGFTELYVFRYYGNTLSIAVCEKTSSACRKLTAASLMKEDHSFMKRKNFSTDKYPIGVCFDNICVVGSMDFTGRPVIQLAALPRYYHDIDEEERKKCSYLTPEQYERFMTFIPPH